jgi:hypothetical protein
MSPLLDSVQAKSAWPSPLDASLQFRSHTRCSSDASGSEGQPDLKKGRVNGRANEMGDIPYPYLNELWELHQIDDMLMLNPMMAIVLRMDEMYFLIVGYIWRRRHYIESAVGIIDIYFPGKK